MTLGDLFGIIAVAILLTPTRFDPAVLLKEALG